MGHRSWLPFALRLYPFDRLSEEDLLLDVRREQRQVHELRHPRPGQPEAADHLCGIVED